MKKNHTILIVFACVFFFLSCSVKTKTVEEKATPTSNAFTSFVSPLPLDKEPSGDPTPTPQVRAPEKGKGIVVGILYNQTGTEFYARQFIYLAETKEMQSNQKSGEKAYFTELDVNTSPFAQTDENGRFVVENVEPGNYALVARLANLKEVLLYDVTGNANILVQVEIDKITDIGVVNIIGPQ